MELTPDQVEEAAAYLSRPQHPDCPFSQLDELTKEVYRATVIDLARLIDNIPNTPAALKVFMVWMGAEP